MIDKSAKQQQCTMDWHWTH